MTKGLSFTLPFELQHSSSHLSVASFTFYGQCSVWLHVVYNSAVLSLSIMSFDAYCFRIGVTFPCNFSEASTSTVEPLPQITCHVMLCLFLNHWSQPLENKFDCCLQYCFVQFFLNCRAFHRNRLIEHSRIIETICPLNCCVYLHRSSFSSQFLLDLVFLCNTDFLDMSTVLRTKFHNLVIFKFYYFLSRQPAWLVWTFQLLPFQCIFSFLHSSFISLDAEENNKLVNNTSVCYTQNNFNKCSETQWCG